MVIGTGAPSIVVSHRSSCGSLTQIMEMSALRAARGQKSGSDLVKGAEKIRNCAYKSSCGASVPSMDWIRDRKVHFRYNIEKNTPSYNNYYGQLRYSFLRAVNGGRLLG
ncbi:unnamed protein product [Allacma fusca]|uniref:Uncharacterized protein n=1 Tax=Allacma fusca TaxID=39272 RepID=A0A8J2NUU2_9HEXA|nr:unnamed protein product [Allacma fusca]